MVQRVEGQLGRLKIGGFEMTKAMSGQKEYKSDKPCQMAVAWSSLESLETFTWTPASDIWSLGVLIWEVSNFDFCSLAEDSWLRIRLFWVKLFY